MKRVFLNIIFLFGCIGFVHGQLRESDIKFRMAQSYEHSGNYEAAVKFYEELYRKDSTNIIIFDALQRGYVQLKRYDEAIVLFRQKLSDSPDNIALWAQLGTVYARKFDEPKAIETWERAIAIAPKLEGTYRLVASSMLENRMFERAVAVYRRGREACGDPLLFTNDIAYLYSIMLNYTEATLEYLNFLQQNPTQLGYVQSRIASYTGRTEGLTAATLTVEHAVTSEPNTIALRQLLAWLYMEGKHFDRAYDVYKIIDSKLNASGRELYNFAERALREKAYTEASKAFLEVQNTYPKFNLMPQLKFGYARTLEESATETDTLHLFTGLHPFRKEHPETESEPTYTGTLAAYDRVISEYPNTGIAAQSLYRLAFIKYDRLFDLDGARASLETIERDYARFADVRAEALLLLGDICLTMGNLDLAATKYNSLVGQPSPNEDQKNTAALRLAEIDYFRGNFQDALDKLRDLTRNPASNVTNDALSLQIFIQENMKPSDIPLKDFAAADLLKRQQKLSESLTRFESIIEKYPKSDIIDETLMNIGDLLAHMGRYANAVSSYERLIKDFPESLMLDRAVMKIAEIYRQGLKDNVKAIETYKQLLEQYPHSIYISEARKRIRELRGDNI